MSFAHFLLYFLLIFLFMLMNLNSLLIKYCIVITVYQIFVVLIKQCTYNMSLILNSCHCTFTHALV